MIPLTIVEKDSSGLEKVLDALDELVEERFIEGIRSKHRTDYEIAQTLEMIHIYQHRINMESRSLTRFSENFIRQYATNNNSCFNTAEVLFKKIQSTIKSLKEVFRKTTPRDYRQLPEGAEPQSVFEKSPLAHGEYSPDLFGLESFSQSVQELYHAMETMFASSASVLALCHLMIEEEAKTRNDIVRIRQIYESSCNELLDSVKAATAFFVNEDNVPDNELEERRKKAGKNFDKFLMENYHKVDRKIFTNYLIIKTIRDAQNQGLTETEAFFWRKNPEKAFKVRQIIEHFDQIERAKGEKDKLKSDTIVMFLKWCGVPESQEIQLYKDYFIPNYISKGKLKPLGWNTISGKRKELKEEYNMSDEELISCFEQMIDKFALQMPVPA